MTRQFYFDAGEILGRTKARTRSIGGCESCGAFRNCRSGKMGPYGKGKLGIFVVGQNPGSEEEEQGRPFVGPSGRLLKSILDSIGVSLDEDCFRSNVVQCFLPSEKGIRFETAAKHCHSRLEKQILDVKPKLILALGDDAVEHFFPDIPGGVSIGKLRGRVIPCPRYGCNVGCLWHPSYILRSEEERGHLEPILRRDFRKILKRLDDPFVNVMDGTDEVVLDFEDAKSRLRNLLEAKPHLVSLDFETSCLSPFESGAHLLSVAFSCDPKKGFSIPISHRESPWTKSQLEEVLNGVKKFLVSDISKLAHNAQFEMAWSRAVLGVEMANVVVDTEVLAHVLDERRATKSLAFQVYCISGCTYKLDRSRLDDLPLPEVCRYNSKDARLALAVYWGQSPKLDDALAGGFDLFMEAVPVLADMTVRGIQLDKKHMDVISRDFGTRSAKANASVLSLIGKQFQDKFGKTFDFASSKDVSKLLFDICGLKSRSLTPAGNPRVDETTLAELVETAQEPAKTVIDLILQLRGHDKNLGTYVTGMLERCDSMGRVHPSFLLHTTESYRSSSENPSFQNIPAHGSDAALVRKTFCPSQGNFLLEGDYGGAEVRTIGMYTQDETLLRQIENKVDLHRYWASMIFEVSEDKITAKQREVGKSGFVFPLFYGSYYKSIAGYLQIAILKARKLENEFWSMYRGVRRWQDGVEEFYTEHGYVQYLSGFRRRAPLSREQRNNSPIQGTAFHLLLYGLIRLNNWLKQHHMKSAPIAEIHDSVLLDANPSEIEEIIMHDQETLGGIMFQWQKGIAMKVDWEVGSNWGDMRSAT